MYHRSAFYFMSSGLTMISSSVESTVVSPDVSLPSSSQVGVFDKVSLRASLYSCTPLSKSKVASLPPKVLPNHPGTDLARLVAPPDPSRFVKESLSCFVRPLLLADLSNSSALVTAFHL